GFLNPDHTGGDLELQVLKNFLANHFANQPQRTGAAENARRMHLPLIVSSQSIRLLFVGTQTLAMENARRMYLPLIVSSQSIRLLFVVSQILSMENAI